MARKRLVLIDGYSLLFRAYYGTRALSTTDGRPTNALFGFVNTLLQVFKDLKPDAVVVALDAPGKTFRHGDYPEYKGTRQETPTELESQLDFSRHMISALNIPTLELVGYEADDVIGTLSHRAEANGYDTVILTGDKDNFQLIDERVTVLMPQPGAAAVLYDVAKFRERYALEPAQMIDYKALAGDSSDNIPGVPKVGDKTATLLLQRFGSAEAIEARIEELEPKYRKLIEPNLELMRLSKRLATIVRDAPVEYDFAPYRLGAAQLAEAMAMMESLEFRSQAKRLDAALARYLDGEATALAATMGPAELPAELLDGTADADALRAWVAGRPWGLALGEAPAQASMFEEATAHEAYVAVGSQVRRTSYEAARRLFLDDPSLAAGHDVKALYRGVPGAYAPPRFDSMVAGYVLQSNRAAYALDDLAHGYLGAGLKGPAQRAVAVGELEGVMRAKLGADGQAAVLDEVELPLIPILAEMETLGIALDPATLLDLSKSLDVSIDQTRRLVYELAGCEFNIGSPKQIGEVLFERLGIPGGKKTKTGWATGAEILAEMDHPVAREIINYRELTKLKGTYTDALPKLIAGDGRVHTSFNQTVAATGRLSSNEPNLQNIPVRTELGRQIRRAFVAAPGFRLGSFDYSQIELRILAHMSHDPNLVDAFQQRIDVHTVTASLMFKEPVGSVTKDQRRLAKLLNYAVLYGVTDFGLANQLGEGFSRSEAAELIKQYNERFPAVKAFMEGVKDEARTQGFTRTMLGRRRYFADIHAANRGVRQYAERQAMNAPLQGTAADMIKVAMIRVRQLLGDHPTRMLLQVHDELVFEVADGEDALLGPIRTTMEGALPLDVPVEVDGKLGPNWLDMAPVD